MSIPSIIVGQSNWAVKPGNLLGYANSQDRIVPREFAVTRALDTATRINSSGNIEVVAANVPRVDFSGGQRSLLVEPSVQNLVLQSTFSAGWSASFGGSVSGNASGTSSPEGSGNAALLSVVSTAFSSIFRTITTVSGSVYTVSVFAKKRDKDFLYFVNLPGNAAVAWFNLTSGTVGTVGVNTTARIENYGNGWYRCSITQTAAGTTSYFQIGLSDADNTNTAASSGSNFVFGAQFELSSVPTSYIPTTTGAVTRNADVVSLTGVAGLIGQTEGTLYAEVDLRNVNIGAKTIINISEGTTANRVDVGISNTNLFYIVRISATESASTVVTVSGGVTSGIYKIAVGYKSGDTRMYINGLPATSQITDTFTFVNALTRLDIGSSRSGTAQLNDRIRAAEVYTTRLTNAQLATLTAL